MNEKFSAVEKDRKLRFDLRIHLANCFQYSFLSKQRNNKKSVSKSKRTFSSRFVLYLTNDFYLTSKRKCQVIHLIHHWRQQRRRQRAAHNHYDLVNRHQLLIRLLKSNITG